MCRQAVTHYVTTTVRTARPFWIGTARTCGHKSRRPVPGLGVWYEVKSVFSQKVLLAIHLNKAVRFSAVGTQYFKVRVRLNYTYQNPSDQTPSGTNHHNNATSLYWCRARLAVSQSGPSGWQPVSGHAENVPETSQRKLPWIRGFEELRTDVNRIIFHAYSTL